MPRNRELYKGRRKRSPWLRIILVILCLSIAGFLLLFYGLQKYIVYTPDGVSLRLPILAETGTAAPDKTSATDAKLVIDSADYSDIKAAAGADLGPVKAIYVPYDKINADGVGEYADRLSKGNALVMQLKPSSGQLAYASKVKAAASYELSGTTDLKSIVTSLRAKNKDIWLVAELSCCVDGLLAQRDSAAALKKTDGSAYTDSAGAWLDPYSADVRDYIVDLAKELSGMGFNEILLTNVCNPDVAASALAYSASTAGDSSSAAVTSFSLAVTRALDGTGAVVSAVAAGTAIAKSPDNLNGQSIETMMKLFDRIYCYTSASEYKTYMNDCAQYVEVGGIDTRFVPICGGDFPNTNCWVLDDSAG